MASKVHRKIKKKKLGNYPHLMVIFSITLALFVIGLFGLLLIHAGRLSDIVKENIEMQVYLDRDLTGMQRLKIHKTVSDKEYIAYRNDSAQVYFLSKEEGAKKFIGQTGEDFNIILQDNPLRDAFILKINPQYSSAEKLAQIEADLKTVPGVYEVQYVQNLIDSINKNLRKASIVLLSFAAILVLTVIILINNTIKLALFSQRFLIRSMQLVGATPYFIQRPFLNRASFQGFISGILASAMLFGLLQYAYSQITELHMLRNYEQMFFLMGALVVLGIVLGFFSSYRAVKKYLRLSLDELY